METKKNNRLTLFPDYMINFRYKLYILTQPNHIYLIFATLVECFFPQWPQTVLLYWNKGLVPM